jgi:hypothetical protein
MRGLILVSFAASVWAAPARIQSATALAFGPAGVLFVGDSAAGAVVALDTGDRVPAVSSGSATIERIDGKIAALLGTKPSEILFHDVKVNPVSKNIYIAVSRGRGPDAVPVIVRADAGGRLQELNLTDLPNSRVELPGLPASPKARRGSRTLSITNLQYANGQVIVAGLSNEDFSSTLRVIPYPFLKAGRGSSIEIYHTSHFTYETNAPVRTMVPYTYGGEQFLLAAYTCTPLVRLRMSELADGAKITGDTVAELGRHSSPIDMILYNSRGQDYLLVANTLNGVLKLPLAGFDKLEPINEDGGDERQITTQRMGLRGVVQLDIYDETRAIMLIDAKTQLDLRSVPLP